MQDGRSARYVPTEVVKDMYDEQGFSKVRSSIQNLLDKKMCKVSAYIGCYAQDLRSKLPLKLAKGLRSKDGAMHVENGLQNTRSNGESEKEKYLKNIQMLPKAALQGKPQKATNNVGSVPKAPTFNPSADKSNNFKR